MKTELFLIKRVTNKLCIIICSVGSAYFISILKSAFLHSFFLSKRIRKLNNCIDIWFL